MTSKLSWITFVPFTLAAIGIKIIQLFFLEPGGTFFGFNSLMLSYLAIACAVLTMLFAVIFCAFDKKTAQVYVINKNFVAGTAGLLLAVSMACEGANRAFYAFRSMGVEFFEITDILLTIVSAIVFVVLGLNHFVGNGGVKGLSVFYLVPAIWSAFRLVNCFLAFTTVSIAVTDVTILACYIFTTMFLFNYATIVALMKGKSPVRAAYIYGLPAVTMLLSYSIYALVGSYYYRNSAFNLFSDLPSIELFLLAIYILSFVVEMSANVKRKDEIELIEVNESDEEYDKINDPDSDIVDTLSNSMKYGNKPDDTVRKVLREVNNEEFLAEDDQVFIEVAQASMNETDDYTSDVDVSDFIYGQAPEDSDFVMPSADNDGNLYETHTEDVEHYITKADSAYDDDEELNEPKKFSMDRIDQLILEISEDEFN
ncbi:MAG: hypothetical protein IJ433_04730 [Ruminococcus sp.]|nr:hypothetical protein [Ruminococcus sp.]